MSQKHTKAIHEVALQTFGFDDLRPGQEEAIESVLNGCDTLVVMPTGSGKSAIYQIPALILDGPTVVVSPLIALQKDQQQRLDEVDAGGAAVVNSLISKAEQKTALREARRGDTEFLFMAPEQFSNPERLAAVKAAKPSLFVVDEAHCISEWGHSFRPDYLRLKNIVDELGHPIVLALTATANEAVRKEIIARLGMRDPKVYVHGFDRPNLWLGVETAASETKKHALLLERIRNSERPGIVYCSTRKHAQQINDELNNVGIPSAFYHGGMNKTERETMQAKFMSDEVEVMVATSAFGMGVDKPNVRFVFHYEPPDSLDSYYQEIGRAGRDDSPASIVLYYDPRDLRIHKFFKGGGQIDAADVQNVLDLLSTEEPRAAATLLELSGLSKTKFSRALNRLEERGAIAIATDGSVQLLSSDLEHAEEASQAQIELHEAELARIEQMRRYAENLNCRRDYLLTYFGETGSSPRCGNCDNCQGEGTERARLIAATKQNAA